VKTFRFYLLILLTVLMPLRGAMAHLQPCASSNQSEVVQALGQASHSPDHRGSLGHDTSHGSREIHGPTQSHGHSHIGAHVQTHGHAMSHADSGHNPLHAASDASNDSDSSRLNGHQGTCSSCSLTCASACVVLPSTPEILAMQIAAPEFPTLTTPASQFLAEGPERPPRVL